MKMQRRLRGLPGVEWHAITAHCIELAFMPLVIFISCLFLISQFHCFLFNLSK